MRRRPIPQLIALIGLSIILAHAFDLTDRIGELDAWTIGGLAFAAVIAVLLVRAARGWFSGDDYRRIEPR